MKVILGQTNPTPGDFENNFSQIRHAISRGVTEKARVVILPELSICGYLHRDMAYNHVFIDKNREYVQKAVALSATEAPNLYIIVGYLDHNTKGTGKPFKNMAAVIHGGAIVATYQKQLLPFYDVFDESRYCEPGTDLTVLTIDGEKWGICICEDIWNDKGQDDYTYRNNPLQRYRDIGVRNIISINSSPYVQYKPVARINMAKEITQDGGTLIYVNQIGGMDDLVFDGHSFVAVNGVLHYIIKEPIAQMVTVDTNRSMSYGYSMSVLEQQALDIDNIHNMIVMGTRDYIRKSGFQDVVIASSGGVDSALVICIACEAIGAEHVHAIRMSSKNNAQSSSDDALQLHCNVGCYDYDAPIDYESLLKETNIAYGTYHGGNYNKVADENIQARLRAIKLMHFSNAFGALALTTGNKSENATGYCTLGGDMMGGFAPIQDCYKTVVYALARHYNQHGRTLLRAKEDVVIPLNILTKPATAELAPQEAHQTDETSLLPYDVLDPIIMGYVENYICTLKEFYEWAANKFTGTPHFTPVNKFCHEDGAEEKYDRIIRLIDLNEFKRRQAAPGIKVCRVAFGTGRRMPIVKKTKFYKET